MASNAKVVEAVSIPPGMITDLVALLVARLVRLVSIPPGRITDVSSTRRCAPRSTCFNPSRDDHGPSTAAGRQRGARVSIPPGMITDAESQALDPVAFAMFQSLQG